MGRPHTLKSLRVDEISLVDAPANPGALHVLFKRRETRMPTDAELAEAYMKREFTAEQRKDAAASGAALPDGSFPISNVDDLKNAIKAVGRASDPGKAKAHIKARAKTLGATAELPDTWKGTDPGMLDRLLTRLGIGKRAPEAVDPDNYLDAASAAVDKATQALATSIGSILADTTVTDKAPAIEKSLAEFRAFTADATAEQIEKAMRDVALATSPVRKDDDVMPTPEEQVATLTKALDAANLELAKAKMSPKHAKFMAGLKTDDAKAKFAAKSPDDREAQCGAEPDNDDVGKRAMVELTKAQGEVADLQKRVAGFEAEREMEGFRKRAAAIGVGEAQAETILKASKGDPDAFGKLLDMVKAATTAARTGAIFKEFGGTGGTGDAGTARAEVESKAETLMKADPKLSPILARVQVRKANLELAQRERDEERASQRVSA